MANSIAITLENFQQVILEESKTKLVLVDFWAQQIPESVELRDKLAIALTHVGDTILYATVDCETQGQIAQQFGIQGLPTAILVQDSVKIGDILNVIGKVGGNQLVDLNLFDVYKGKGIEPNYKSLAIALTLQAVDRTLEEKDINLVVDNVVAELAEQFNASLRD